MRALILVALLGCSATVGPSRAAWGLDLAGVVASAALMPTAFEIDGQPQRLVAMSALFASFVAYGWSAKSAMRPTRAGTVEDCVAEIMINQETIATIAPRRLLDVRRPPSMGRCATDAQTTGETWRGGRGPL